MGPCGLAPSGVERSASPLNLLFRKVFNVKVSPET